MDSDQTSDKPKKSNAQALRHGFYMSLAESRYDAGITQAELARRTGIPQSAITRIENGKANPTIDTILKIAVALEQAIELVPTQSYSRLHLL